MTPKPNAKDYALPPSCISADDNAEGGLAKHLEPLCLSLAERVLLYNQEILFLQGKEILQGLAKLNANGVAAAAAVGVGLASAAELGPAGAGTPKVRESHAELMARGFASTTKATENKEARKKSLESVKESTRKAAKAVQQKDKDTLSDAESSQTEGREQAMTRGEQTRQALQRYRTVMQRIDAIESRSPWAAADSTYYEEQRQKATLELWESMGVAEASAHNNIVPKVRAATVGKTVEKNGANAAHIKEKNLNKRVRSPIPTSHSDVGYGRPRRASEQTENLHRNKKVKVEVESEPGNGGL